MRDLPVERIAELAGAELLARGSAPGGPAGVSIDSRAVAPGELFVGLRGENVDGGAHAEQALAAGAWGALVTPGYADTLQGGVVLTHEQPLEGLQKLAAAWREELGRRGAKVVAITGSVGKTSTKDILAALLSQQLRTSFSPENLNTEIGLPLALLAAPADTQALVLEMAMRGKGQIAELMEIARPDVGAIVNIGPAHIELLGSLEAIAAAKAELIAGMAPGATAIVPVSEPLLEPHLRDDLDTVTFGAGGDVHFAAPAVPGEPVRIRDGATEIVLEPSFVQAHQLQNLLPAVAAARAIGVTPHGRVQVEFSSGRGERCELAGGIVLIDDTYNAGPLSMRAALDELAQAGGRRVAVLGDMLELGEQAPERHREIGTYAHERGVSLLVAVGELAAEIERSFAGESVAVDDAAGAAQLVPTLLGGGETVLVKGSRGVGLEVVSAALREVFAPLEDPVISHHGRS